MKCEESWSGCNTCSAAGCSLCDEGYYLESSKGQTVCKKCSDIDGCVEGQCTMEGCQQCVEGSYVNGKTCSKCESAIVGCKTCDDGLTCTSCKSDFLTVVETTRNKVKKMECKCDGNANRPHMIVKSNGSCDCEAGYWLTEDGCKTCGEIIPGCDSCYTTTLKNMFEIYNEADVSGFIRQMYVSCRTCEYDRYFLRGDVNNGIPDSCPLCSSKWEGCGNCSA